MEHSERQECPMTGCKAPARVSGVVKAGELGCDKAHTAGGKYGTKLRKIVERIEAIPEDDRIIVFVQVSHSFFFFVIFYFFLFFFWKDLKFLLQ